MPTTHEVGKRLKDVRTEMGMTLKDVANASGMSPTHISEIERGKTSPTVGALRRIAAALGRDTAFFVEDKPLPRVSVVKKEDRESLLMPGKGDEFVTARRLTTGIPAGRISVVLVDEAEGRTVNSELHDGEEAIIVMSGQMTAKVAGEEYVLNAGDCLHYAGRVEHSAAVTGSGRTKALWIRALPGAIRW
jgi:transcriptional regulator with XRE-family HTH domain